MKYTLDNLIATSTATACLRAGRKENRRREDAGGSGDG
jgi:hypothetical protein